MRLLTGLSLAAFAVSLHAAEVARFKTDYTALELDSNALVATSPGAPPMRLTIEAGQLRSTPWTHSPTLPVPPDMLPDGRVMHGTGAIRSAWLGGATGRYDHGVLGDRIEASRLYAVDASGDEQMFELGPEQVFEDRWPRLADIDGDGEEELLVIRSDVDAGAALASYGLGAAGLVLEAASRPIGLSHRWLNVVGVADFDGDGGMEIAAVVTPHIGGTLTLYRQRGNELLPWLSMTGFSNHRIGSHDLGMSAIVDLDGDGIDDLLVPDARRRALRLIRVQRGRLEEFGRIANAGEIRSDLHLVDLDGEPGAEVAYLLADGTLVVISP